jgi:outer membrane protein OmpA-like peptidoglycan-associated protein
MADSHQEFNSTVQVTKTRYFQKLAEPRWPFMPWGLLPLLGLGAVTLFGVSSFAQGWIEKSVHDNTRAKLNASGLGWVKLAVSGQQVTLSGEEPKTGAGNLAIDTAKEALCQDFAGEHPCAISVEGSFTQPAVKAPWPDYKFVLADGVMVLRGQAPDEATRTRLVEKAKTLFRAPEFSSVKDELTIAPEKTRDGYEGALLRGVETASRCVHGESTLTKEAFGLQCEVHADTESPLRADASKALTGGAIGTIALHVQENADACEKEFADALAKSSIEFDTGSFNIRATSNPLLDKLAEIANRCSGKLRVEGHTDDRGQLDANMKLSRDRAESVQRALVSRKVDGTRMNPQGFGPTKPIGDNATDPGRAKNRRIEFHINRD